jgi:hypothetical protein
VSGWSLTTYDNHDRSKVLLQGERLIKIEQLTHFLPARVHHILSQTLATEDTLTALYFSLPPYTVGFHLINLVCTEFTLPFHHNPLLFHLFIHVPQLGLEDLEFAHTGLFVHVLNTSSILIEKLTLLTQTGIRVCLITASEDLVIQPSTPPLIIPPDSLIVHTGSTWSGDTRPSHTTRNLAPLYCHTWNLSQEETVRLKDIIHGRSMSGEKWELSHPIHTYCPEANTPIWEHIEGTHPSNRLTAAFWGGRIDEEVMMGLGG